MKKALRLFVLITLSFIFSLTVGGARAGCQEKEAEQAQPACALSSRFDVYGKINWEDEQARLDNFAIALQNNTRMKGYIMVYSGTDDLPGIITRLVERPANYLVNSRGLGAERLTVIKGGYREEREIELWVLPSEAPAPEPSGTIEVDHLSGLPYQFDEAYFDTGEAESQDPVESSDEQQGASDAAADEQGAATTDEQVSNGAGAEVVDADEENADAASVDDEAKRGPVKLELYWCAKCFADALKAEPKARGYLIYYDDGEDPNNNQVQEIVLREKEKFAQKYGIDEWRVEVFYGGYSSAPLLEIWIGPENAQRPTPKSYPRKAPDVAGADGVNNRL
ncbi:MAG: hypothetical protein QOD00_915 [Blastocatellia bacterium]|jgi:hypothetical protein|nr:hypothetical protein [Blastocatellia bacterium]